MLLPSVAAKCCSPALASSLICLHQGARGLRQRHEKICDPHPNHATLPRWNAVSHSTVQLPVAAYQQRLQRLAAECAAQCLPSSAGAADDAAGEAHDEEAHSEAVLQALQRYLYEQQGFRVAPYGRSNLPAGGAGRPAGAGGAAACAAACLQLMLCSGAACW